MPENDKLRTILKQVRDESKHPYEVLVNGQTLGEAANIHAVRQYSRKIAQKRDRARESRNLKRMKMETSKK